MWVSKRIQTQLWKWKSAALLRIRDRCFFFWQLDPDHVFFGSQIQTRIQPIFSEKLVIFGSENTVSVLWVQICIDMALPDLNPLPFSTLSIFFMQKFNFLWQQKTVQDPKPDPQWFGSLYDPHWGKKLDPDPLWNQCGSATLKYEIVCQLWLNLFLYGYLFKKFIIFNFVSDYKKGKKNLFIFHSSLCCLVRDPGWKKSGSEINIPDPQH